MREQGSGQAIGNVSELTNWVKTAQPNDVTQVAITALDRIAQLPTSEQQSFFQAIHNQPNVSRLLEDLKTYA